MKYRSRVLLLFWVSTTVLASSMRFFSILFSYSMQFHVNFLLCFLHFFNDFLDLTLLFLSNGLLFLLCYIHFRFRFSCFSGMRPSLFLAILISLLHSLLKVEIEVSNQIFISILSAFITIIYLLQIIPYFSYNPSLFHVSKQLNKPSLTEYIFIFVVWRFSICFSDRNKTLN